MSYLMTPGFYAQETYTFVDVWIPSRVCSGAQDSFHYLEREFFVLILYTRRTIDWMIERYFWEKRGPLNRGGTVCMDSEHDTYFGCLSLILSGHLNSFGAVCWDTHFEDSVNDDENSCLTIRMRWTPLRRIELWCHRLVWLNKFCK